MDNKGRVVSRRRDLCYIKLGKNSTKLGKAMSIIKTMRSQIRKGIAAKQISPNVVPEGADPFITNNSIPKGGVDMAISRFRSMRMANHMGS